jgi:hypothetical protein
VKPVPMVASAFPKAPSCGTTRTDQLSAVEKLEGSLVQLTSSSTQGVRLGGLPVCKRPEGDDPIHAVRSTCNLQQTIDGQVRPVEAPDCTVAGLGDPILRDALNRPCFRGNQACKDDGRPAAGLRSTCNPAATESCALAEPGDKVLRDEHGSICRNTFDDFLTSGLAEFGQAKALFEVNEGGDTVTRCATVNFDGLTGFSAIDAQERGMRYRSLTGTLRQVRFSSGSSFWIVDVRFPEDLEPLPAAAP